MDNTEHFLFSIMGTTTILMGAVLGAMFGLLISSAAAEFGPKAMKRTALISTLVLVAPYAWLMNQVLGWQSQSDVLLIGGVCSTFVAAFSLVSVFNALYSMPQEIKEHRKMSQAAAESIPNIFDTLDANEDGMLSEVDLDASKETAIARGFDSELIAYLRNNIASIGHDVRLSASQQVYVINRADLAAWPGKIEEKYRAWPQ